MLPWLGNFFCVVFVKSPDKLLNYLMFDLTSIEVKMEILTNFALGEVSCFIVYVIDSPCSRERYVTDKFNGLTAKGRLRSDFAS